MSRQRRSLQPAIRPPAAEPARHDSHKFRVGQTVRYSSPYTHGFGVNDGFKVVKLLPSDGEELQYRIKSAAEPHERVAKESQLAGGR